MTRALLQEKHNCWKIAKASRLKFLIDDAEYFAALSRALEQAQDSILIVGWDFDSRIRLNPDDAASNDLGALLNSLAERRPNLHIHILIWDYALIFALEREMPLASDSSWQRHPRIHFHMDGHHPVGASHHEKIVVIDDAVAFVGGLDLASGRWILPNTGRATAAASITVALFCRPITMCRSPSKARSPPFWEYWRANAGGAQPEIKCVRRQHNRAALRQQ